MSFKLFALALQSQVEAIRSFRLTMKWLDTSTGAFAFCLR